MAGKTDFNWITAKLRKITCVALFLINLFVLFAKLYDKVTI